MLPHIKIKVAEAISLIRMTLRTMGGAPDAGAHAPLFVLLDWLALLTANGIILRISSEAVTPLERINALPKVQRRLAIYVICVIVFLDIGHLWAVSQEHLPNM